MHRPLLDAIDRWIAAQPDPKPSRPEAIRLLLTGTLTGLGYLPSYEQAEKRG